jgi:hypothetical protein
MSNFIKITNNADSVDRRFLEKLGISSKRDDESTIGQFGSGAKLAPIAALRMGIRWITVAKDDNGPYTLEYISKNVDGIDTIFYKYDDLEKESSFTLDAGVLSWDEDFQVFREAFANAVDSGDEYSIEFVDEISSYAEGKISVYLTAHESVLSIVNNFDQYFLFDRSPILTNEYGSVYKPSRSDSVRIYNKGVFVYDREIDAGKYSLYFDWGFNNLELNEERRMKNVWQLEGLIAKFMASVPDDSDEALTFVKDILFNGCYEFERLLTQYSFDDHTKVTSVWSNAWVSLFTDKTIPVPYGNNATVIEDNLRASGYRSRFVPIPLAQLLYNSGVLKPENVLGNRTNIKVIECPSEHAKLFEHAVQTVAKYDERLLDYRISIMQDSTMYGLAVMGQGEEEIFISEDCLELGYRQIVLTLIHELDHVVTGHSDSDYRQFRQAADERIVDLVLEAQYGNDITAHDGWIAIGLNYLASLGSLEYEVMSSDIGSLLRIGDITFYLNVTMTPGKGVISVGHGNQLMIEDLAINKDTIIKRV